MSFLDNEDCSLYNALAESAGKLAYSNFKWQYATFLFFNATFCGVNVFVKTYNKIVVTGQIIHISQFLEYTPQFVLFVIDNSDISDKLEFLGNKKFNNAGRYIIVCNSIGKGRCDESEAVKLFWKYRISNVVLIKYDKDQKVVGYTYFMDKTCGPSNPQKLMRLESCIHWNSTDDCVKYMFPKKFQNLFRCPLFVSTFSQDPYMFIGNGIPSGADGNVLKLITEILNATLIIVTPKNSNGWGRLNDNGTWSGSFGDIYYDRANMSMTSASITTQRFQHFQMSTNYNSVSIGWVTHPAEFEPSSFKLLKPFSFRTRVTLTIIFAIKIFLAICIPKYFLRCKLKRYLRSSNIVTNMLQIYFGLPLNKFPAKWFLKYVILLLIWYCYIVRSFYQANLIIYLQTDTRTDSVLSIEEAIQQGYSFGGGAPLKDYFEDEPIVYNKWMNVELNEISQTMIEMAQGRKFVLAMNLATTKSFLLSNPHKKLHVLPQKILSSPSVIFFKKYSMIAQSINEVLARLFEAGITDKMLENFMTMKPLGNENVVQPIKLEHLEGCFALLFLGWTLSIIVAIIEKIVKIYSK